MRILLISILVLGSVTANYAQQYYVVVGAFGKESNAQKFTGYVRSLNHAAHYELNKEKNYYYVYVLKTTQREDGLAQTKLLQEESEFKDAWVFSGQLGEPEEVAIVQQPIVQIPEPEIKSEPLPPVIQEEPKTESVSDTDKPAMETEAQPQEEAIEEAKVKGMLVKFVLQRLDRVSVPGEVHIVDYDRGRNIATYKSDEYVDLPRPSKANNPMSIVCGIFGYKEELRAFDYDHPELAPGVVQDEKGAWVIPFMLERFKKGDVTVMYHVTFYKDAVVMLPQSKTEIDELVNLMKGNPDYKIKIHGHCNGDNSRRIIALGTVKNYFDINGSDERKGSAKELSKLRAEAIQSYLEMNGIEKNRTEVYAWGALNMLVSETSPSAKLNDRIEIEILQD